ncbi:MAG: ABC transporter ATP-binding protein [Chloroflexota bacterium]|nr:ABC transporter ATP-binding protein [Chloroflexota bacterium]
MPGVRLENLTKRFGEVVAVDNLNLEVEDGEILTFLGPSGCGKTTTLRCIAGLLIPEEGEIYLGNDRVTSMPAEKRGLGLVFQNYALWPHMTVFQNLAFGLELRKIPKPDIVRRIDEALALVRLSGMQERFPRQLSGGQQQRVALARALILEPKLLLLDEPLSNLDAQLREEMRFELRELQKSLGITSIYVTHDQAEALVLSDRVAIMEAGRLVQIGTPVEIYSQPTNKFVAGFVGLTSFLEGRVTRQQGENVVIATDDGQELLARSAAFQAGDSVTVALRPEHITLNTNEPTSLPAGINILPGRVERGAYLGDVVDYRIGVGSSIIRVHTGTEIILDPGDQVFLTIPVDQITLVAA